VLNPVLMRNILLGARRRAARPKRSGLIIRSSPVWASTDSRTGLIGSSQAAYAAISSGIRIRRSRAGASSRPTGGPRAHNAGRRRRPSVCSSVRSGDATRPRRRLRDLLSRGRLAQTGWRSVPALYSRLPLTAIRHLGRVPVLRHVTRFSGGALSTTRRKGLTSASPRRTN
jgi:hypothetical protein